MDHDQLPLTVTSDAPREALFDGRKSLNDKEATLLERVERMTDNLEQDGCAYPYNVRDAPITPRVGVIFLADTAGDAVGEQVCLARALLIAAGLIPGDDYGGFSSLLTRDAMVDQQGLPWLGTLDRFLLKLLYDPRIKRGAAPDEVNAIFADVFADHRPPEGPSAVSAADLATIIDPIDRTTLNCTADAACSRDVFLDMTLRGSSIEPNRTGETVIKKRRLPLSPGVVSGRGVNQSAIRAAKEGVHETIQLLRFIGAPVVTHPHGAPTDWLTGQAFLTLAPERDRQDAFAETLARPSIADAYVGMMAALETNACVGKWLGHPAYGLVEAVALIPIKDDNRPWLVKVCVIEELMQTQGLFFDIDAGYSTLFDDRYDNLSPTGFDLFLLALLYHPKITYGMVEADVNEVFDQVHTDVWRTFRTNLW